MRRQALAIGQCALAAALLFGSRQAAVQAQPTNSNLSVVSQPSSSTGVTSDQPPPLAPVPLMAPLPGANNDPLSAAATAILKAAGVGNSSAESAPAPPRANPFTQRPGTTAAVAASNEPATNMPTVPLPGANNGGNLVIPANPLDPSKAVVNESDGLVSLMVREGSLRQVIAMVAETQKLNIVFAGPADTVVTAAFDRQPWQTVLDSLLSASGHVWAIRDNVIFVSSVDNADFLPPGAEGRRVQVFELDFASAIDINQTVSGLLSPAGKCWLVETNKMDNRRTREAVAVMDYPANLARVADYICQADQPPRQVYIEVNVLQVQLKDDCKNGINFNNLISTNAADITLKSVGMANSAATTAFFVEPKGTGLTGLVELLKTTTDAKTLASPKIHAVSGQESHIQIGGQLGYRVTTTTQTSTMESVQFLNVGVVLKVTPRVTRDGRVLMRIYPKVSKGQVDPSTGLPSEDTTEVQTDVLLSTGQGIVIGGLIQEEDTNIQSRVPLLGDIPYLGVLFQKRQVTRSRQEIIVTLQPHILPYEPVVQARLDQEFYRASQPLTQGAIISNFRPYEPKMYDPMTPKEHKLNGVPMDAPMPPATDYDVPVELPSVIDPAYAVPRQAAPIREETPEELPPPEAIVPNESLPEPNESRS
jgi:type II secretory pathway component GspD/PulD (secretin)